MWMAVIMFCLLQDKASPDEQIQIQLVAVPMYGILTRSQSQQESLELREYSSFTMEDINTLKIRSEMLLQAADPPPPTICPNCSPCCCGVLNLVHQTGDRRNCSFVIYVFFLGLNQPNSTHKKRIR